MWGGPSGEALPSPATAAFKTLSGRKKKNWIIEDRPHQLSVKGVDSKQRITYQVAS